MSQTFLLSENLTKFKSIDIDEFLFFSSEDENAVSVSANFFIDISGNLFDHNIKFANLQQIVETKFQFKKNENEGEAVSFGKINSIEIFGHKISK